jgi:LemA protein
MGKIIGIVFAVLAVFGVASGCSSYNGLVVQEENVSKAVTQVQNVLARQANLLPNLAEVVQGYAKNEKELFTQVAEARAGLTAVAKLNPKDLASDPKLQKQLIEAQTNMNQALINMRNVAEQYPDLKSAPLFANLMAEVAGSQNRITVERRNASLVIGNYNVVVRHYFFCFP